MTAHDLAVGDTVRVLPSVERFGGMIGTVAGRAGLVCDGALYVNLPGFGQIKWTGELLPGIPFDPDELEQVTE